MSETNMSVRNHNDSADGDTRRLRMSQMNKLLSMRMSTTKYLEKLAGKKLQVETEFQKELFLNGDIEIVRVTRLYFDDPGHSIIYSITSIPRRNLSEVETAQIRGGKIPLGRIFKMTETTDFKKTGMKINAVQDRRITKRLNVQGTWFYSKEYCLRVGKRRIGSIKEIFNEESFARIWGG